MSWVRLKEAVYLTARTSAMVCFLFVGSSTFASIFSYLGGEAMIKNFVLGLDLSPGNTFEDTVGVKSNQRNQLDLVKAGDPDASYLVRKCEGGPDIAGVLMPQGCGLPGTGGTGDNGALCLSNDDIAAIRQWISECALDN